MHADLNKPTLSLVSPVVQELLELLVASYGFISLAQRKFYATGAVSGTWPEQPTLRESWTEALKELARQNLIDKLIDIAISDPTIPAFRSRFENLKSSEPTLAAPTPTRLNPLRLPETEEALSLGYTRWTFTRVLRKLLFQAQAVCRLSITATNGKFYGTGFLVDSNQILTNYHVLQNPKMGRLLRVEALFDFEDGNRIEKLLKTPCNLQTIQGDLELDWATIETNLPQNRFHLSLGTTCPEPEIGEPIFIIHHPSGIEQCVSADFVALHNLTATQLFYSADTLPGSSGAPVFNQHGEVVGLHRGASEKSIELTINDSTIKMKLNFGTRIDAIKLTKVSPT